MKRNIETYKLGFFPPRLSGTGMTSLILRLPLLKCRMIVCLSSLLLCELPRPSPRPMVLYCHFGVSPINYSDLDSDNIGFTTDELDYLYSKLHIH